MPGRRQKVTDEDVFAAAARVMSRRGPHELTLAEIAAEAGVTAGRLVQRFGSKRKPAGGAVGALRRERWPVFRDCGHRSAPRWRRAGVCRLLAGLAQRRTRSCAIWPICKVIWRTMSCGAILSKTRVLRFVRSRRCSRRRPPRASCCAALTCAPSPARSKPSSWIVDVLGHVPRGQAADWISEDLEAVLAPCLRDLG